jgi:hypothetical protein
MSSKAIQQKGKSARANVNLQSIRFIKSELKIVRVADVVARMGYAHPSSLYFHLNEERAGEANRDILLKIIEVIEELKKQQDKKEKELEKKIKTA